MSLTSGPFSSEGLFAYKEAGHIIAVVAIAFIMLIRNLFIVIIQLVDFEFRRKYTKIIDTLF
jgi:hypothetical protein